MIGETKYYLTVLEHLKEKDKWGNRLYSCACKCGNKVTIGSTYFKLGRKKSCGCYPVGRQKEENAIRRHYLYRTYISMKTRCYYEKTNNFHNYGGRGIKVCDRWLESFSNFLEDMGDRPEGMSLDRIDNDGNYCKENCKWSTRTEQAMNRRTNNSVKMH